MVLAFLTSVDGLKLWEVRLIQSATLVGVTW